MSSANKNPYGLRNGQIISVEDLDPNSEVGLKCNCICPSCGDPLIARIRGTKKEKHFAHKSGADCGKAYESALHRLAKQVIDEGVEISLPPIESTYGNRGFFVVDGIIRFPACYSMTKPIIPDKGETVVEKDMGAFRPDVSIKHNGIELFIEIQVTHPVDDEKKKRIQEKKISCIEIDFSYYKDKILKKSDIRNAFAGKDNNIKIRWIYNKIIEEHDAIIRDKFETSFIINSYKNESKQGMALSEIGFEHKISEKINLVLNCPLKKHVDGITYYAKKDECTKCKSFSGSLFALNAVTPFSIICREGDNNVEIDSSDAAKWLIHLAKKEQVPSSREKCVELIESNSKKLGSISDNPDVKKAKEQAIKIILSRFEKDTNKELINNNNSIDDILNEKIFWAKSTFTDWIKLIYENIRYKKLELIEIYPAEEAFHIIEEQAKKIWNNHCNEGRRLYEIDNTFHSIIDSFINEPISNQETQNAWLNRVTNRLLQNRSAYMYSIPFQYRKNNISAISILPFLEKITKDNFTSKSSNSM